MQIHPVILAGGSGTRLWPLSRESTPKQLLPLLSERTMLQQTVERARMVEEGAAPIVVCGTEHRFLVAEQLREIGVTPLAILLEPCGRNTAPAAAVAAMSLLAKDPEAVMLLMPADHAIADEAAFRQAVQRGLPCAAAGRLGQRDRDQRADGERGEDGDQQRPVGRARGAFLGRLTEASQRLRITPELGLGVDDPDLHLISPCI